MEKKAADGITIAEKEFVMISLFISLFFFIPENAVNIFLYAFVRSTIIDNIRLAKAKERKTPTRKIIPPFIKMKEKMEIRAENIFVISKNDNHKRFSPAR